MAFLFQIIRLGLKNIGLHKLRSTLTSLGIILGVAAVIVVVSIGEGNKQACGVERCAGQMLILAC